MCLGLIFERRIRLLHLGPPCSTFSMACNRFHQCRLRSHQHPAGLPTLNKIQRIKTTEGNGLADVAAELAVAQTRIKEEATFEQPASSLMLVYEPVKKLAAEVLTVSVSVDVCMFGAPWIKPTKLLASFPQIKGLKRVCDHSHVHIGLQGKAPCGENWTVLASPYWPKFAQEWVRTCAFLRPASSEAPAAASHLTGFAVDDPSTGVVQRLQKRGFKPARKQSPFAIVVRVRAVAQPRGLALPTLLPEGLGPESHLAVARAATHPVALPFQPAAHLALALSIQQVMGESLLSHRSSVLGVLSELALATAGDNDAIIGLCHKWVKPIIAPKNIAFMRELDFVLGRRDPNILIDLCSGLPMEGWARHSPTMTQRVSRPPAPIVSDRQVLAEHNAMVLSQVRPSKDPEADLLTWAKCIDEVNASMALGPFASLDDLPFRNPRILKRVPILERHGGATESKVRLIDDAKMGGQNECAGTSSCHIPCNLDSWASMLRLIGEAFPEPLLAFCSDFKAAYKQIPADPGQASQFVMAVWDPASQKPAFFVALCQIFGSNTAPLNFCRIPEFCCFMVAACFGLLADHCVDDLLAAERSAMAASGFMAWRALATLCGFDVPDSKSPPPSDFLRTLGADTDLTQFPDGPMVIRPATDRVEALQATLSEMLDRRLLSPGEAGKLFGKLGFASSQFFGRCGRALLRSFSRRQHESRSNWNPQLEAATLFWWHSIGSLRPREIPFRISDIPTIVSYSDGEGAKAGVGVAVWFPDNDCVGGYICVPDEIRRLWSRSPDPAADPYDIMDIEAVGPALVLHNFGHRFQNCLWMHFVDNESSVAALAKGSTSVNSAEIIVAWTHSRLAKFGIIAWFDRVDTKSNPVDGLSRGDMSGPWRLLEINFPPDMLSSLRSFLDAWPS